MTSIAAQFNAPREAGGPREMVGVSATRERFVNLTCVVGELPLAEAIAAAVGFDRHRDGSPSDPADAVNGVLVAIGLAEDRFGGQRTKMRRYRERQFAAALEGFARGYLIGASR